MDIYKRSNILVLSGNAGNVKFKQNVVGLHPMDSMCRCMYLMMKRRRLYSIMSIRVLSFAVVF